MVKRPKRLQREPFTFWLDPDLMAGLRQLQEQSGVALAEAMRRAIRAYLTEHGILTAPQHKRGTKKR